MLNIPSLGLVPMNTKTIFAISLATVFALSFVVAQDADAGKKAGHLETSTTVTVAEIDGEEFLKATIKAKGPIKNNGQFGAYGYGLFTDGGAGNNVLALTTHMCASDSPVQGNVNDNRCPNPVGLLDEDFTRANDGPLFHAHILDLMGNSAECNAVDGNIGLEVDVASSLATNGGLDGVSPDFPIKVSGKTITVGNVPVSVLNDNTVDAVASFEIVGLATGSALEHLCLTNAAFE